MIDLQHTILEASNSDLITFEEASVMLAMYESDGEEKDSMTDKIKKAWEAFKKWLRDLINKLTGKKINDREVEIQEHKWNALNKCAGYVSKAASKNFSDEDSDNDPVIDNLFIASEYFGAKTALSPKTTTVTVQDVHDLTLKIHKDLDKITEKADKGTPAQKKVTMAYVRKISNNVSSIENQCTSSDNTNYDSSIKAAYQKLFDKNVKDYKYVLNLKSIEDSYGSLPSTMKDDGRYDKKAESFTSFCETIRAKIGVEYDKLTEHPDLASTEEEKAELQKRLESGNISGYPGDVIAFAKNIGKYCVNLQANGASGLKTKCMKIYTEYHKTVDLMASKIQWCRNVKLTD